MTGAYMCKRIFFLPLFIFFLNACATSSAAYKPSSEYHVETERVVNAPFDVVWDKYVAELSKSFFVINNISKESKIINVSFSANKPSEFIDCGSATRQSYHPATGEQTFNYQSADSSSFNVGQEGTNVLWTYNRNARLEGRANIYIAPEQHGTLLRVNAKYVWSVTVHGYSNTGGLAPANTNTLDFSSTTVANLSIPEGVLTCRSKGILEKNLLNLI